MLNFERNRKWRNGITNISDVYTYQRDNNLYHLTLDEVQKVMYNKLLLTDVKTYYCETISPQTYFNKQIESKGSKKQIQETVLRNIITSFDVIHDSDMFIKRHSNPNDVWKVALVINLSGRYSKDGKLLPKKKKVKCLTILLLSKLSIEETQRRINVKNAVPCLPMKSYCGFLPIVYAIQGFKDFREAYQVFDLWKKHTRGPFSRTQCGIVIFDKFKKSNKNLQPISTILLPEDNIKLMSKYK